MSVILVDDDKDLIEALGQAFELEDINVKSFRNPVKALKAIDDSFKGTIVTDVRMPEMDGLDLFKKIYAIDPQIPVIVMTGHADVPMVLSSLKDGVFDFLAKPIATKELISSAIRACETRALVLENRRLSALTQLTTQQETLIGDSESMTHLREMISQIAAADVDVLIEGETGTGKQTVARMIHKLSDRSRHRFVDLNCASLVNETALEELYGLEGSSTPYRRRRKGKVENADRGILYLNKLESTGLDIQGQFLQIVENREIIPIDGNSSQRVDIRIIASSSVDLHNRVISQEFRSDLYFRLNTIRLKIPALRERREDIPLLFAHFLNEAAAKFKKKIPRIKADTRRHLYEYDWPGNVQELKNFSQAVVLGITHPDDNSGLSGLSLPKRIEHFEAATIRSALQQSSGNVPKTIEILGIPRKTFYDKVNRHKINLKQYRV